MEVISDKTRLSVMANFPGMIPAESRLLRQFIRRHGDEYDEFRFNVRLGEGVQLGEDFEAGVRKAWEAITKARPDTVGFKYPNRATLIEVKEAFANEAVWQLLSYRDLYVRAYRAEVVTLAGVAAFASPTARALARSSGVSLWLYALPAGQPDINETAGEVV